MFGSGRARKRARNLQGVRCLFEAKVNHPMLKVLESLALGTGYCGGNQNVREREDVDSSGANALYLQRPRHTADSGHYHFGGHGKSSKRKATCTVHPIQSLVRNCVPPPRRW